MFKNHLEQVLILQKKNQYMDHHLFKVFVRATVHRCKNSKKYENVYDIIKSMWVQFAIKGTYLSYITIYLIYLYLSIYKNLFFLTPTDRKQISFIISSPDFQKLSVPSSILVKISKRLKLLLSTIKWYFWYVFLDWAIPSALKKAKAIPILKQQYKVDYTNYRLIFPFI